jgi:prepilin-type N-terminal cleavage/methylation domain-containing protein
MFFKKLNIENFEFQNNSGLTLIELLLVIGILAVLFSIGFVGLTNIKVITGNNSANVVLISDLKTQQIKAMTGDTEGRGVPDNYGVKILSDRYVLFHGLSYNASDPSNFTVPVGNEYVLSTTFPNNMVIFASESGQLVGFVSNQNTISITSSPSGQIKTLQFNEYGTITNIN